MIRSSFRRCSGQWCGFTLKGHAGAGEAGNDVVCAAVSSAAYLTANTITEVCSCRAEIACEDGFLQMDVVQADAPRCQEVLQGFYLHMQQLQEQYPNRIQVNFTEV